MVLEKIPFELKTLLAAVYVSYYKNPALASVAQLFGALSHKPKGRCFNSQSGRVPRVQV